MALHYDDLHSPHTPNRCSISRNFQQSPQLLQLYHFINQQFQQISSDIYLYAALQEKMMMVKDFK